MHRCRHDLAYEILKLCREQPTYVSEMYRFLAPIKYPTLKRNVLFLVERYCIEPVNPDGSLPFEGEIPYDRVKHFMLQTKQYPYLISKGGEIYLNHLETLAKIEALVSKYREEDRDILIDVLFPNRFTKPKKRTIPKHPECAPKKYKPVSLTDSEDQG